MTTSHITKADTRWVESLSDERLAWEIARNERVIIETTHARRKASLRRTLTWLRGEQRRRTEQAPDASHGHMTVGDRTYSFHRFLRNGDVVVRISVTAPSVPTNVFEATLAWDYKTVGIDVTRVRCEGRMLPAELPAEISERAFELAAR